MLASTEEKLPTNINLDFELWPKQEEALETKATELLFGGATEGGKSHLVRVALIEWCIAIPHLQCVLIRKKYKDIIKNHVQGPNGFKVLLRDLVDQKLVSITREGIKFWNGSVIDFVHCQDERQFDSAQGVEKHVIVIDEATQISARLIKFFRAWCRMDKAMKERLPKYFQGRFPRIIYTANPIGASVAFFRREFVKARAPGAIEKVNGFYRQYIPSKAEDNMAADLDALEGRLDGIGDEAVANALRTGNWDAPVGDFYPEYDEELHVVPDFIPPDHWFKYRAFDWGAAEPFAVLWAAVSDGEEFIYNQKRFWFPRGALVVYREWYGANPKDPSEGLRMRNPDIAKGILERTTEVTSNYTLTDSLPFQDRGGPTIASVFFENGVPLTRADTSRKPGWSLLRDRLKGLEYGYPLIYFCQSCAACRDYVPALERDPKDREDAVKDGEATHICDTIRYLCASNPIVKEAPPKRDLIIEPNEVTFEQARQFAARKQTRSEY